MQAFQFYETKIKTEELFYLSSEPECKQKLYVFLLKNEPEIEWNSYFSFGMVFWFQTEVSLRKLKE